MERGVQGQAGWNFWANGNFFYVFFPSHGNNGGRIRYNRQRRALCILLSLRAHGWTRQLPQKNHVADKAAIGSSLSNLFFRYNVELVEMSGAIGIEQLKKLPSFFKSKTKKCKTVC